MTPCFLNCSKNGVAYAYVHSSVIHSTTTQRTNCYTVIRPNTSSPRPHPWRLCNIDRIFIDCGNVSGLDFPSATPSTHPSSLLVNLFLSVLLLFHLFCFPNALFSFLENQETVLTYHFLLFVQNPTASCQYTLAEYCLLSSSTYCFHHFIAIFSSYLLLV
jgi:hypothetical protein